MPFNKTMVALLMCVDVFNGGSNDGSIIIWDTPLNRDLNILGFGCKISSAHGKYNLITYFSFQYYLCVA